MKAAAKNIPVGQRHAKPTQPAARLSDELRNSHRHHLNFLDSIIRGLEQVQAMRAAQASMEGKP